MKPLLAVLSLGLLLSPFACAQQAGGDYLDDYIVKVKPDKRAEYDAISKKVAEANRKAKGDTWLAMEQFYGDGDTVMYVSPRKNFADVEQGNTAFMAAVNEAYGAGGMKKMMMDYGPTIVSARSVVRRRRWDLTVNAPKDENAYNQLVGNAHYLMSTVMRVKPGHDDQFMEIAKQAKAALEQGGQWTILISQSFAGRPDNVWYRSVLLHSLSDIDSGPNLKKLMGDEQFAAWMKLCGEALEPDETTIYRFLPELSNPPKEIADVAPDFWHPKTMTMSRPKPKPAETAKTGQQ
jgi:hypothetical protein